MSDPIRADLDALKAGIAEIQSGVGEALQEISDLKAQVAAGNPVTQADLDELHAAVSDLKSTADQLPQPAAPPTP